MGALVNGSGGLLARALAALRPGGAATASGAKTGTAAVRAPVTVQILTAATEIRSAALGDRYENWFQSTFGTHSVAPNTFPATSWRLSERWGAMVNEKMVEVEEIYAEELLRILHEQGVPGAVVEFGVFRGDWLLRLLNSCERLGMTRAFYGFDSFVGLPPPSATDDLDCWAEGDYAASLEEVAARLDVGQRKNVTLVKGWFSDSLPTAPVQAIREIAFARVDCDLYGPTVECLDYLAGRLTNGAILVFDDWTFDLEKGETKAFREWVARVPQYRFEFLCFNGIGHVYVRVHHAS